MQYKQFLQNITQLILLNIEKVVITTNGFRTNCSICETQMIKYKQSVEGSIMS